MTAGGNATVTVQGTGGATTGGNNYGVYIYGENSQTTITSGGGNIQVTGQGGGLLTGTNNDGVFINLIGQIVAPRNANLTIVGTGSTNTGSNSNGVNLSSFNGIATISSGGGTVNITGSSTGSDAYAITMYGYQVLAPTPGGTITFVGNSMEFANGSVQATPRQVNFVPKTAGTLINMGGTDSLNTLGLTNSELGEVFASSIQIGNSTSGALTVSSAISLPGPVSVSLMSGSDIVFNPGSVNTGGGAVALPWDYRNRRTDLCRQRCDGHAGKRQLCS